MKHTQEYCKNGDDTSKEICEDDLNQKCLKNEGLCEALRSIYAIAGEDDQISKIVNEALKKYEI